MTETTAMMVRTPMMMPRRVKKVRILLDQRDPMAIVKDSPMLIFAMSVPKVDYCTGIDTQMRKKGFPDQRLSIPAIILDMAVVCKQNEVRSSVWNLAIPAKELVLPCLS